MLHLIAQEDTSSLRIPGRCFELAATTIERRLASSSLIRKLENRAYLACPLPALSRVHSCSLCAIRRSEQAREL